MAQSLDQTAASVFPVNPPLSESTSGNQNGNQNGNQSSQRPWGAFTILEEGIGYKIKRIEVKPGHRLSLQMHHHRSEHWIVVSGTARVVCGDNEIMISTNQSTYVPKCTPHRLENPGVIPLVLIEVQNGEYLGEDDIIRFQDDYARHEKDNEKAKSISNPTGNHTKV